MNTPNTTELKVFEGKSKAFKLSSGRTLTIREKNGDDDDILSDMSDQADGRKVMFDNFHRFISSIVVRDDDNNKPYFTTEEAADLKLADKYQLLLFSRIHSDGPELNFTYICDNPSCTNHKQKIKMEFTQDLNEYVKEEDPNNPFPYSIFPHPHGQESEFVLTLSSSKKIRYKYLTGRGEYKALEIVEQGGRIGKNLDLIIRDLEVWDGTAWQQVGSFSIFNSKEMREIRASVEKEDPQWQMATDVKCPKCNNESVVPLISLPDFFYPTEI